MWFIHIVVAVLGLLSTGHSAPVTSCESLIQPIEIQGRDQVRRTRFPHAGSFEVVLSLVSPWGQFDFEPAVVNKQQTKQVKTTTHHIRIR